jgi:hypothetical protein
MGRTVYLLVTSILGRWPLNTQSTTPEALCHMSTGKLSACR